MYIETIAAGILNYPLGNKIDEDGYLTNEVNPDFKFVYPPKKRDQYASEEEYSKAVADYQQFRADCDKHMDACRTMMQSSFHPLKQDLVSKSTLKATIKTDNETRIRNNQGDDAARLDIDLTSSETKERKATQEAMQKVITDKLPIQLLGNTLMGRYCHDHGLGQAPREVQNLLSAGVENVDELFRDFGILVNGSQEEKNKMFKRKLAKIKELAYDLCDEKSNEEYVEIFKKDFLTVNVMSEMQYGNMDGLKKYWGIQIDAKDDAEIQSDYNAYVAVGSLNRKMGIMANPYYSRIKETCHKAIVGLDNESNPGDSLEMDQLVDHESNRLAQDPEDIKNGKGLARALDNYLQDQDFEKYPQRSCKDLMYLYFKKNAGHLSKIKTEDGKEIEGDYKAMATAVGEELLKNKTVLIYDSLGNFKTKINIPDYDLCDVPQTYSKMKRVNFRFENTSQQLSQLKKEFGKLDSWFSHDHQEYTDMKDFMGHMEKDYKNGTSLATLCGRLRKLAVKYMESKYTADTPEKTARTFQREEFMCRLIGSIDEKYPIIYPAVKQNTIKDLEHADLKNDKLLNDVIAMNKEGRSREEVETYVQNQLWEEKKQVEINLAEDKKDNAPEAFIEDKKEEEIPEIQHEGMSEKD